MEWPASPPDVLLVVDRVTRERLDYDDPGHLLEQPRVSVIAVPVTQDAPAWLKAMDRHLRPGTTLIQDSCRPGVYVPAEEADWRLALSKATVFAELCQDLGAKSVNTTLIVSESNSRRREFKVDATMKGKVGTSVSGSVDDDESAAAKLVINDTYTGAEPDLDKARRLLESAHLDDEPSIAGLVALRSNPHNTHLERVVKIDVSAEATRTIQFAARVNVPLFLKLDASLKEVARQARSFTIEYRVKF